MTAPWHESVPAALPGALGQTCTVQLLPAAGDPVDLEIEAGTVTFDDSWSPHVQADLVCRVPQTQATLDLIDPRKGVQVLVRAGYTLPGGRDDTHDLALLELRSRPVRRPANTMALAAESAECRLQDFGLWTTLGPYSAGTPVPTAIASILSASIGASLANTIGLGSLLDEAVSLTTGADLWSACHDQADRAAGWLYVDGAGTWHLDPWPTTVGLSAHIMTTGPGGNLSETEADLDAREWGNAVILDYGTAFGVARTTSGPFAIGTVPRKTVTVKRDAVPPGTQAARDAAAAQVLRRVMSRGRGFTLTGPAAYWLRPGHTVTAKLPTGPQERHLVSRVTFDLATGAMTVRTRVPDDDTTITPGA